ncbi:MAG: DNA/RNA nuclease SfsA [Pseudomonadota bacterium]
MAGGMQFPTPLQRGVLVKRYKRFLADIRLDDGSTITAHCANPGSMLGVAVEGAPVWVSEHRDGKRKLPYSWQLVEIDDVLIPVNTTNANRIVAEALSAGAISELSDYKSHRAEVKYGDKSRIDFLLTEGVHPDCFLEVKNVHLSRAPGLAEFPDSVTTRGAKHLRELTAALEDGSRSALLFVVQRRDCTRFRPAEDLDPAYAEALRDAAAAGVEILCYDCDVTTAEVGLRRALPIDIQKDAK